jgi:hypothetical protein
MRQLASPASGYRMRFAQAEDSSIGDDMGDCGTNPAHEPKTSGLPVIRPEWRPAPRETLPQADFRGVILVIAGVARPGWVDTSPEVSEIR